MKRIGTIISVCLLGILVVSACGTSKKGSESNQPSAVSKKEKETILPIGNEYVYQDKSRYEKLTILSENEWSLQTDEMHFPEKFQVKDTKQDKDGFKLLEMTANKEISGIKILAIYSFNGKPIHYYLVNKGNQISFVHKFNDEPMDIEKEAEYEGYLIKQ